MAADNIFLVKVYFELPTSGATYGLYYRETTEATGSDLDTQLLAEAFDTHMGSTIIDMLSDDCQQPMISCQKLDGAIKSPRFDVNHTTTVGAETGPSLPNNSALVLQLNQGTFSSRSNGRIRIPGIPEPRANGVTITAAYQAGSVQAFITKLALQVPELSAGPGRWTLGVISAKVRDAAPPFKDWDGAFAPVTGLAMNTIIGILRIRQTRAEGVGGVVP